MSRRQRRRAREPNNNAGQAPNTTGNPFADPVERVRMSFEDLLLSIVTQPTPPSIRVIEKLIIKSRLSIAFFFQEVVSKFETNPAAVASLKLAVESTSKELAELCKDIRVEYQNFLNSNMTVINARAVELKYYSVVQQVKEATDDILFSSTFNISVYQSNIETALGTMNQAYEMKKEVWRFIDALFLPFKVLAGDHADCYVGEKGEVTILQEGQSVPTEAVCIKKP